MKNHSDVPQGMERRLVVRLLQYWRELAGASRNYPARSELDPQAIGDPWNSCFVLDLSKDQGDPAIEYVGDALSALCGAPRQGTPTSAIPVGSLLGHATSRTGMASQFKVPIVFRGEFRNHEDTSLLYRGILTPLVAEPHGVTRLLGAASAQVGHLC